MKKRKNKIGRNDPCFCGSKKKYKRCCFEKKPSTEDIEKIVQIYNKQKKEKHQLEQMGILINYVKPVLYKGRKVWGLGDKIYHNRTPNETFHEFVIFIFKKTLGKEWFDKQQKLEKDDQHHIFRCFDQFRLWMIRHAEPKNKINQNVWGYTPDGWSKNLLSLAFDVASLQHTDKLPRNLLERLKNYNEYQGAKYEITVAAIIARLGFDIEFTTSKRGGPKHCEFIATERKTKMRIGIEAKSRQRDGVLHRSGTKDKKKVLKGDVSKLISKALQKSEVGQMPFLIFIDMNCPLSKKIQTTEKRWVNDVIRITGKKGKPTIENPNLYSAIFFTNFSYHYQESKCAGPAEVLTTIPLFSLHPIDTEILKMIQNALQHHGQVPMIESKD